MVEDFMNCFKFNTEIIPDRLSLINIQKKSFESFQEYARRWRSEAKKVQPPMDESELMKYFIRSQKGVYFEKTMSTLGQKFADCVKMGNFIEEAINSRKIKSANNSSKSTQLESIEGAKEENEEEIFRIGTYGDLQVPPEGAKQKIEFRVKKVLSVGTVDAAKYPLPKTKLTLELLRDFVHFRSRTNTISAIARIRSALAYATHTFFQNHGFLYIHTPIITTSDCEGAGEMFQVTSLLSEAEKLEKELKENPAPSEADINAAEQLAKEKVFLTVSGQLQGETYACALSKVYTFGPTFRAEKSHTSRHLAEFWMVEPEIAFVDIQENMNYAEAYVKFLCQWLLYRCLDDVEFITNSIDNNALSRLRMVASSNFQRITYTDTIKILEGAAKVKKFENKLTEEHFKAPVIVYNYPKGIKAFYMKVNEDKKTVAAMDLLVPKVGELIGGSQREEDYEVLRSRMLDLGLPLEPYEWYLDLRRHGTVKHCGFGLGFERMILFATGIENIWDVIPFPRYPDRADL
ncbi:Asparagine--tRNA ligase [Capsicum baccatum]|uniref:asparagine--tRNA ligase n=1 Tax=Capsicum baccatum TaxID=33114 RepID=A0A2G2XEX5_CAPBA|nr:Asparagine--tRNA ligase [Capsicum baccatum]